MIEKTPVPGWYSVASMLALAISYGMFGRREMIMVVIALGIASGPVALLTNSKYATITGREEEA